MSDTETQNVGENLSPGAKPGPAEAPSVAEDPSPAETLSPAEIRGAAEIQNVIEAALLAAGKSLTVSELSQVFDEGTRPSPAAIRVALEALAAGCAGRPVELKETGAGFRLQVRREYAGAVARLWPERPQRYSRALLETLALIAYRQPITRAEIEAVRGVSVNPNITKTLLERGWIRVVGHRDLPGRPELLGTTREFLEYFGLLSLDALPPLAQLRSLGELDPQLELGVAGEGAGAAALVQSAEDAFSQAQAAEAVEAAEAAEAADAADAADAREAEDYDASAQSSPGLVAAPPDTDG
jgi:segregation and condensation protein B